METAAVIEALSKLIWPILVVVVVWKANIRVPIFIYTTSLSVSTYHDAVLSAGGNGITSSPVELFEMIDTWDATALQNPHGG